MWFVMKAWFVWNVMMPFAVVAGLLTIGLLVDFILTVRRRKKEKEDT